MTAGLRVLVVLSALLLPATVVPRARAAEAPIEIHAILPLTGQASFLGQGEAAALRAVEAVVDKQGGIRGRPVRFVVQDDTSSPQVAVQLLNQLIADKVNVVLGSSLVAICGAMLPILKDGPVAYCMSNGVHPPPGSYMFTSAMWTKDMIVADVRYLRERGWTKIAMITSTDATGQDAERSLDEAFARPENKAIRVVAREHFNTTDVSVAAQMARIRAANPDALIAWSSGTPAATLFRGEQEAGLDLPTLTTAGNLTYVQMKQYGQILPKELYFAGLAQFAPESVSDVGVKSAVQTYLSSLAALGIKPDYGEASMWDPAMLVVTALRKLGPAASAAQIRDYIDGLSHWVGADGIYDFKALPQRGLDDRNVIVIRWDAAKGTWVGVSRPGGIPLKR
jgi:branched-chain amino acid transport system substrate-binding protein